LPELVARCKPEKIFTSVIGKKFMQAQFDTTDWPIETVKTGDVISIGKRHIHFVETRMLHWPDSMFSYIPEDKLLISNDAFGQNIASVERFADQIDPSRLLKSIKEYYYNIVLPFSPQVLRTLEAAAALKLDIEMIAPDHGLIWRGKDQVNFILSTYKALAEQKPACRAVIVYDTMWESTALMASSIGTGLAEEGVPYRLIDLRQNHHSDVMTELADCGAVIIGSPTHNNNVLPGVADTLTYMKGLRPLNRIGAAFGSYAWSGEAPKIIQEWLASMHMELPAEPLKMLFRPKHNQLSQCVELGRTVAKALKKKCAE
ncbi:MAG: flavodoxin domain-containing protein, partial [Deltaproteobacteria bacterium]|nr:flavodoxin domain-containing protein [Deltaproteobacteria bacterium]